ncbi:MAG: 50S ribosomal protein L22 [Chloroflexi bacterium]|nr:50S ribosomal protein L22 [Chloroflexota bacterium]
MAVRAYNKSVGISAFKLRKVADLIRGRAVDDALNTLRFMISPSATVMFKTIASAAANAENNELMDRGSLKIVTVTVDQGTTLRRFRPRARGRVGAFNRPSSHLTVEVDESEGN